MMPDDEIKALWTQLEPLVQAAITNRIIQFHDALVMRGQIPAPETVSIEPSQRPIN